MTQDELIKRARELCYLVSENDGAPYAYTGTREKLMSALNQHDATHHICDPDTQVLDEIDDTLDEVEELETVTLQLCNTLEFAEAWQKRCQKLLNFERYLRWAFRDACGRWDRAQKHIREYKESLRSGWYKHPKDEPLPKMTPSIEFSRQIDPSIPGPDQVRPHWCYIGTLIFYKNGTCEKVWEQEIPEARHCQFRSIRNERGWTNVRVEYDRAFGWLLKFELSHDEARRMWEHLGLPVETNCD